MATYSEELLEQLLKRGDEQYNVMVSNFEEIFDRKNMPHFTIRSEGVYDFGAYEVMEKHGEEIQRELISWIHNEHNNGQLFIQENWKPFRDRYLLTAMFVCYRKLFQFKNYYFGLLFDDDCDKYDCKDCPSFENRYNFQLLLYGWLEEDGTFYGNKGFINLERNTISEWYWKK